MLEPIVSRTLRTSRALPAATAGLIVLLVGGTLLVGCDKHGSDSSSRPAAEAQSGNLSAVSAQSTQRLDRRQHGRKLFMAECSGCHGERGRGDGPASPAVEVKPRDFIGEKFKYRSTASGAAPRRDDIVAAITRGMPGSAMPAFQFLSEEERGLVADYVLYLAGLEGAAEPEELKLGPETPANTASVTRGRQVYQNLQCAKCHGESGLGDGPSAATLVDSKGRSIASRDLKRGAFRRGETAAEIARTFMAGIDGTPMPSYSGAMSTEEMWDLTHYVQSLRAAPEPAPTEALAHARQIVQDKQCFACHVIEGRGGRVGPSLDVSARKLRYPWVKEFLANPRAAGKIYMFTPYRMPDLGLRPNEIDALVELMAHIAGRSTSEATEAPIAIAESDVPKGQLLYVLKCAECHNLGNVIPTPLAKQQGPDLIHIQKRLRFEWIPEWVKNPMAVYPGTQMVNTNLNDEEIRLIRAFLWKTSTQQEQRLSQH